MARILRRITKRVTSEAHDMERHERVERSIAEHRAAFERAEELNHDAEQGIVGGQRAAQQLAVAGGGDVKVSFGSESSLWMRCAIPTFQLGGRSICAAAGRRCTRQAMQRLQQMLAWQSRSVV